MAPRPEPPADETDPGDSDVPADGTAPDLPDPSGLPDQPEPEADDDARWADIVARLQADDPTGTGEQVHDHVVPGPAVTYPVAPHRADHRVVRPAREPRGPADVPDTDAGWTETGPGFGSGRDWDGTAQIDDAELAVDDREHFVPPDPGPVLGGDPLLTTAWLAVVGAPLLWLVVLIAWRTAPAVVLQASGIVFVLGLGLLLWRMPHRRDESDDDTGAVV